MIVHELKKILTKEKMIKWPNEILYLQEWTSILKKSTLVIY